MDHDPRLPWLRPTSPVERAGPEDAAGLLSRYMFWWVYPSIREANAQERLTHDVMPHLPWSDDPQRLFDRCAEMWRDQRAAHPRLVHTLTWGVQRSTFLKCITNGLVFLLLMTADPLLLRVLLSSAEDASDGGSGDGSGRRAPASIGVQVTLVCVMTVSMLLRVSCQEVCFFASARLMNNVRSVLVHAVFRKSLGLSDGQLDVGKALNLMATDADKLGCASWFLFATIQAVWAFLALPFVVAGLYSVVGPAALVGSTAIVVSSVVSRTLYRLVQQRTRRLQQYRDARSSMLNELLRGIRTVKLQGWEPLWHERLTACRESEMRTLVRINILGALNSLAGALLSLMVPLSVFAFYVLVQQAELKSSVAFAALAWINLIAWTIQELQYACNNVAFIQPSLERLTEFLMISEHATAADSSSWWSQAWHSPRSEVVDGYCTSSSIDCQSVFASASTMPSGTALSVLDASFGYIVRDDESTGVSSQVVTVLEHVNLSVRCGELVMICGPVGAGKSLLLASLAGAKPSMSGQCAVQGRRAYVSQKPFLLNSTLRDNVLFGYPFDSGRYNDAIRRSALEEDINAFPAGHDTLVGENGLQLSGGQKTRIALARALYADADIVLFDDLLSAVDAHTGRFLWGECIVDGLLKRRKTVVLVSHQIQYLSRPEVDRVVLLRDGQISLQGPWSELVGSGDELLSLVNSWFEPDAVEQQVAEKTPHAGSGDDVVEHEATKTSEDTVQVSLEECQDAVRQKLRALQGRRIDCRLINGLCREIAGEGEALESIREGNITWTDFRVYLSSFGSRLTVAVLVILMILSAACGIMSNVWLSLWTGRKGASGAEERRDLAVYALIGVGNGVVNCLQAVMLTMCALAASRTIHRQMLQKVLAAPLSFFDTSPTGRVLNRFLQDLQNIDSFVPNAIADQVTKTLNVFTQLSLVYVEAPWVLLTLPGMLVPYSAIFRRMRVPNRDARRLESAARSPVYAHFGDTLHGRQTVRAFAVEHLFEKENLRHINSMATAKYCLEGVGKWAQILTIQWGCSLYFVCGIACVFLTRVGAMTVGQMGLVLLYAAQLQRSLMDYMMSTAEIEKQFVSVERAAEYTRLDTEDLGSDVCSWTSGDVFRGDVVMDNICLRYKLHRPLVLDKLAVRIPAQAKLAICGRTGCGKSSVFGALSRLYPLVGGRILVGGVDIMRMPLRVLRSNIRAVSQDAFLVSGSLRWNLSMKPCGDVPEDVLWHVLEIVGMSSKVRSLPGGLDHQVEESGSNFSVGERQLLTLARALVPVEGVQDVAEWRPPAILLADEATANVDMLADEKVHEVLLALDATVLMICHRLQHIRRFQCVAVLRDGRIEEFGTPADLLGLCPPSMLAQLCIEAGAVGAGISPKSKASSSSIQLVPAPFSVVAT